MHRATTVRRPWREVIAVKQATCSTALEVFGAGAITVGAAMVYLPAGFVVGGLLAVGLGWLIGDGR